MSVSADSFGKLAEKIDEARRTIRTAASAGEAELKDKVDQARKSADDLAAELSARAQASAGKGDSHWQQIQRDWERHRQDVRQRIDEAKKLQDLDAAEDRAEWAEADVRDAVAHASEAIDEATYAMLDAIQARKEVGALLQASS